MINVKRKTPAGFPAGVLTWYHFKCRVGLSQFNIDCVHAFFATLGVKSDGIAFANVVNQTANVNEDFFAGAGINNKTKTFSSIEKLYCSTVHW